MPTRDECLTGFAAAMDVSDAACAQMTPAEQARAAWHPGSAKTVEELEAAIRADRGLPPVAQAQSA